jgi:hypothetical protein
MISNDASAQETKIEFSTPGAHKFTVPSCVTSITVEAWGGGGKGSRRGTNGSGGGGGGGAYVISIIPVTPGVEYDLYVGAGCTYIGTDATPPPPGEDSWFGTTTTLLAKGGNSALVNSIEPVGGQSGSIGEVSYDGGFGANGYYVSLNPSVSYGGGGGSSGGITSNGNYPDNSTTSIDRGTVDGGGAGGNGASGANGTDGLPGSVPGGGGGGGYRNGLNRLAPGLGANGQINIYYVSGTTWIGGTSGAETDWNTSTNWCGGVPTSETNVIISSSAPYQPVVSNSPTAECLSLTINTGASLTINAGQALTVGGTLSNSGTLNLNSSGTGIASLKVGSYTDNGTENIQLYLTGDDAGTGWHYISSPVSSVPPSLFTAVASTAVAEYQESLISTDMNNGWVTSLGYHYNTMIPTPAWESGSFWIYNSNLVAGRGYYYYSASTTSTPFNIQGSINTGDVPVSLSYNSGVFDDTPAQQGFNLIGNPFTCGIDWDLVVLNNSIWTDVEAAIYFRSNGVIYTYNGTTTVPGDLGDGAEIPPMQGFFIKANAGATLSIPAAAKIHTGHVRYKGSSSVPLVRLQIQNSDKTDETVIGFNDKATMSFDNLFDARKIFATSDAPYIYSSLEGTKYTINAIPFPQSSISIPLVINASTDGSYTITATQIEGLENYKVYLLDKSQNFTSDISSNKSYSFNSSTGLFTDRFVLTVSNILTGIPENSINNTPFNIYWTSEMINVQTLSDDWNGSLGEIRVLDLAGRLISINGDIVFSKDEIRQLPIRGRSGIYFVQINSGQRRYVGRVMIK